MDKEALKALGLNDEQVAAVFEDYGKNYVTKVGRIAGSSFCVKRKIAGSLGPGAGSASHRDRDVCRRYPLSVIRFSHPMNSAGIHARFTVYGYTDDG